MDVEENDNLKPEKDAGSSAKKDDIVSKGVVEAYELPW